MSGRTDSRNSGGRRPRSGAGFDPLDDSVNQGPEAGRKIRRLDTGATAAMRQVPGERKGGSDRRGATKRLPPLTQPPTGQVPKVPASASPQAAAPGRGPVAEQPSDLGVFGDDKGGMRRQAPHSNRAAQAPPGARNERPHASNSAGGLSQRPAADLNRPPNGPQGERSNDTAAAAITAARLPKGKAQPANFDPSGRAPGPSDGRNFDRMKAPDFGAPPVPEQSFDPNRLAAAELGPSNDGRPNQGLGPSSDLGLNSDLGLGPESNSGEIGSDDFGAAPQYASSRAQRQSRAKQSDGSLQDTEMKLAGRRRKPKPKEPNRLLLAAAVAFAVLIGGAVFYFTRGGDEVASDAETEATGEQSEAAAETDLDNGDLDNAEVAVDELASDPGTSVADQTNDEVAPAAPAAAADGSPTFVFTDGTSGPIQAQTEYPMEIGGAPVGSMFQLVVNGKQQGEPEPTLRKKIVLPAGQHNIFVEVSAADGSVINSNAVEVYVVDEEPATGYRANLSSVNIVDEGWTEAMRQFKEYQAAGHDMVRLAPSDPYPSLVPGYWNIFVDGFGADRAAAQSYCEQFSLAIPDDCFPAEFDPQAPAKDDSATTTTAPSQPETSEPDAMEDGS